MTVERRQRELERNLKSRRGSNRRAAFDALRALDEARAIRAVTALVREADGKNRAELGALLVSTGDARFVDEAARGRYGDCPVYAHAPAAALEAAIAELASRLAKLQPADVVRRAGLLGVLPAAEPATRVHHTPTLLVAFVDDARLPLAFRQQAALQALAHTPWAIWQRRGDAGDAVPDDVAFAGGLASEMLALTVADVERFLALVARRAPHERTALLQAARLPKSLQKLPAQDVEQRVRLAAAVLHDDGADVERRVAAAGMLADMRAPAADEAILAHPELSPRATVRVCERMPDATEVASLLAPLVRAHERFRDAVAPSGLMRRCPGLVDAAAAALGVDPFGAAALLVRSAEPRAVLELKAAFEVGAPEALAPLLMGVIASAPADARTLAYGTSLVDAAGRLGKEHAWIAVDILDILRKRGVLDAVSVDEALARLLAT